LGVATINLQWQHGQWKKTVGYWVGTKGTRVERLWWLGSDRQNAERLARALVGHLFRSTASADIRSATSTAARRSSGDPVNRRPYRDPLSGRRAR
jgi:hypothetical protein